MSGYCDLIQHATASVQIVYGVEIDALSFFFAYSSYRPLLRFLALARLRLQRGKLFLKGSSSPSPRLPILDIPHELSHEIFKLVFASLLEEAKLAVLDKLGLCSHAGGCEQFDFPEEGSDDDDSFGEGFEDYRKKMREFPFKRGQGGVCLIDLERGQCCVKVNSWEDDDEGNSISCRRDGLSPSGCDQVPFKRAKELEKTFAETKNEITSLINSFDLSILAYPDIVPSYSGNQKDYYDTDNAPRCLPAALGLPPINRRDQVEIKNVEEDAEDESYEDEQAISDGTRSNLDLVSHSRFDFASGAREKFRDHAVLRVPDLARPSEEEEGRFERLGRALRLKDAGGEGRMDFRSSLLVAQTMKVKNTSIA